MKPQITEGTPFPLFFVQLATVDGGRRKPFIQRFLESIRVRGKDDCWECTLTPDTGSMGYCRIRRGSAQPYVHRIAYEMAFGPIPPGALIMHTCDNPRCANPHHLRIGSDNDNYRDMAAKGRRGKRLTHAEVREIDKALLAGTSHATIARRHDVSEYTIRRIEWGAVWAWVTGRETPRQRAEAKAASTSGMVVAFRRPEIVGAAA